MIAWPADGRMLERRADGPRPGAPGLIRRPSCKVGEVKPPPFEYHAPTSLDEALALLAEHGDEAKVLAGGQSLVPLMSLRLAHPAAPADINRVQQLRPIDNASSALRMG